ncbi:type 1 glutamine amidotransferase family protein [Rhodocytophaga rosea]|nr:type 1 glutamine amidotransferase family protein [Rhodocytophaga rosea]
MINTAKMHAHNIYVFLFDGFSDWEIAYLTPELYKSDKANVYTFTVDRMAITSGGGLKISPHVSIEQINSQEVSMLVLPGGTVWEEKKPTGIDHLLEEIHVNGKTIAAICGATTFLAEKGYLDDIKHTSNALPYLKQFAPAYKGSRNYISDLAVTDRNIITANGIAPIEFAREVFKKVALISEEGIEQWYQLFKNGVWSD